MQNDIRPQLVGKKILIFDYDQTIVDSAQIHADAFMTAFSDFKFKIDYSDVVGLPTSEAIRRIAAQNGAAITDEKLVELTLAKQAAARRNYAEKLALMPGARDFIFWARQRYQLAIFSSGSANGIRIGLSKFEMQDFFYPIISSESVTRHKPDPAGLELIQKMTAASPEEMVLFDDSPHGCNAALAFGIDFIDVSMTAFDEMRYR